MEALCVVGNSPTCSVSPTDGVACALLAYGLLVTGRLFMTQSDNLDAMTVKERTTNGQQAVLVNHYSYRSPQSIVSTSPTSLDKAYKILYHALERFFLFDTLITSHQPVLQHPTRPSIDVVQGDHMCS